MSDYREGAEQAIVAIEQAAERLAVACKMEMILEDERPIVKALAVKRIMARDNLAATPAEKIVESDMEYLDHRKRQYDAVVEKQRAYGAYEAAKRRADVAIDMGMLLAGSTQFAEPQTGELQYDGRAIANALAKHLDSVRCSTLGSDSTRARALEVL